MTANVLAASDQNLVWIDLEMTGLDTGAELTAPMLQGKARMDDIRRVIAGMQAEEQRLLLARQAAASERFRWTLVLFVGASLGKSGLIDRVKASVFDEAHAAAQVIEFLKGYVASGKSPMCGNSICQDRRFLANYMPALEAYFHYRNLDVSTLKELAKRWKPEMAIFKKAQAHTALADIHESIDELLHYREHFLAK